MPRIKVNWSLPDNADRVLLQIRDYPDGDFAKIGEHKADEYEIKNLPKGVYEVAAHTVSAGGAIQPLAYAARGTVHVKGKSSVPVVPTSFGCAQNGTHLDFAWTAATNAPDGVTYEIRRGIAWAGATLVAKGITGASYRWPWTFSGSTLTFRIKATDPDGNWSTSEQTITQYVKPLENYEDGQDTAEESSWGGTTSNTLISGSTLELSPVCTVVDDLTGVTTDTLAGVPAFNVYHPSGTYITDAVDMGSERDVRIEVEVCSAVSQTSMTVDEWVHVHTVGPDNDDDEDDPTAIQGYPTDGDDRHADTDVDISLSTDGSNWDDYRRWVPGDYHGRHYKLKITVRSRLGRDWQTLTTIRHLERKKNRKREGRLTVTTDSAGTYETFSTVFLDVPTVTATIEGQAATGEYVKIGTPTVSGVTIWCYDDADALVARTVAMVAAGT